MVVHFRHTFEIIGITDLVFELNIGCTGFVLEVDSTFFVGNENTAILFGIAHDVYGQAVGLIITALFFVLKFLLFVRSGFKLIAEFILLVFEFLVELGTEFILQCFFYRV